MDANTILSLIFRMTIWFLLTADFSLPNTLIGLAIALILPRSRTFPGKISDWLKSCANVIKAIPQAYAEAVEIIFRPHDQEDFVRQKVNPKRSPLLVFLDIFLITFTPKTIVIKYDKAGWYEIHRVRRRKPKKVLK